MKHLLLYLTTVLLLGSCNKNGELNPQPKQEAHQWKQAASLPGPGRKVASSFVISDKFYVGLGSGMKDNRQQQLKDFYQYSPSTNTWKQLNDFPGESRENAVGFSINGKGYVALGQKYICPPQGFCDQFGHKDFWEYNPENDSWKKVANFDFLGDDGRGATVFTVNDKAYIMQGQELWEFNPVGFSLTPKAKCPESMAYATAFTLNNKGYIGTGGTATILKSFYEYDPATDKWTKKADFGGQARNSAVGFSLNGKGYIGYGEGKEQISYSTFKRISLNDIWEYNPEADNWSQMKESFSVKLTDAVSGVVQGRAIIGTGKSNTSIDPLMDFWIY